MTTPCFKASIRSSFNTAIQQTAGLVKTLYSDSSSKRGFPNVTTFFQHRGTGQGTFVKEFSGTDEGNGGFKATATPATADGGWAALFRATVLITDDGAEVL